MLESPAYRILSLSAHRALSRIEIEFAHHGGHDNGKLPVTFDNFFEYGIRRSSIGPALDELEALGFIEITEHGKMARAAEYRRPNKFLLMSRPKQKGVEVISKWRRFKTVEEAQAALDAAVRQRLEKKKPPVPKRDCSPVPKRDRKGKIASTETVPLRMSETVPLSISRGGTPQEGRDAEQRSTTPAAPPTPADAIPSQSPNPGHAAPTPVAGLGG